MPTAFSKNNPPRVLYLFTTFPIVSETFLQREIRIIRTKVTDLSLNTIWGGKSVFEDSPVHRFRMWELVKLVYWLPYWLIHKPAPVIGYWMGFITSPPRSLKNIGETLLGYAYALIHARRIESWQPDIIHAVWATMPATAAMMLKRLVGCHYSMGAHAYDIFQNGGDCFLKRKLEEAEFVHTSTRFARKHLVETGAEGKKVHLIRRGLSTFPKIKQQRTNIGKVRLLSIGRLVEKKGYEDQFRIYRDLRKRGIPFEARIVGDGPLRKTLSRLIETYQLERQVDLVGSVPHEEIQTHYEWCDLFIFTGLVAKDGDRNGLANVIPEAMARGIPVLSTPDSGIIENFKHDYEMLILPSKPIEDWVLTIKDLIANEDRRIVLGMTARHWVERQFDATKNSEKLFKLMVSACNRRAAENERPPAPEGGDQSTL